MTMHSLSNYVKTVRVMNGVAAGTTDQTSSAIDTLGFAGVRVLVAFGAITGGAVTSIYLQQSSDDAATDAYSDIAGTSQTVADTDDNKVFISEVWKPGKRYLKCVVDRGTQNAVIDGVWAELYGAANEVATQDTTVGGFEHFNTPAEGTA